MSRASSLREIGNEPAACNVKGPQLRNYRPSPPQFALLTHRRHTLQQLRLRRQSGIEISPGSKSLAFVFRRGYFSIWGPLRSSTL